LKNDLDLLKTPTAHDFSPLRGRDSAAMYDWRRDDAPF
jgi:hypothetical protein